MSKRSVGRGRPPFGYDSSGNPVEEELKALDAVERMIRIEAISYREGAEMIEHMCGKTISHVGLRDRLSRGVEYGRKDTEETGA